MDASPRQSPGLSLLSRLSIRLTIPALLTLPPILACILLIVLASGRARAAIDRIVLNGFALTHNRILDRIDEMVSTPQKLNELNHQLIQAGTLDLSDLASWDTVLRREASLFGNISCISWDGADARHAWIARYPGSPELYFAVNNDPSSRHVVERRYLADGTLDPAERTYTIDPREFAPFKAGAKSTTGAWAEPFNWVSEDGSILTRALAYVTPIRDDRGELLGVITAQFTLDDIGTFLHREQPSPGGRSFILDTSGFLLADSRALPILDEEHNPIVAARAPDEVIAAATAQLRLDAADPTGTHKTRQLLFSFRNEPWLLVATPFEHRSGLRWIIVTCAPEADFLTDIQQARRDSLMAALAITAVTIIFGIYLASVTLRPMIDLKNYLRQLGAGQFDARINLPYAREFLQISDAINRMTVNLKAHLKLKQDVAVADEIQRSLLPSAIPSLQGLDLAAFSHYCDKTGGDYYDFLEVQRGTDRELIIAVGDVMGHGLPAAMLMATTRGILRSRADVTHSVADMLTHANRHILGDGNMNAGRFMTLLLLSISTAPHRIRFASAGHDTPIAFNPASGSFLKIDGGDLPLGVLPDTSYLDHPIPSLVPGAILVLGTDGLWETRNPEGKVLGKDRVRQAIETNANRSAAEVLQALRHLSDNWRGRRPMEDDLTLVVVKFVA